MNNKATFTNKAALSFLKNAGSNFKFRLLMFFKIPLIWFSGIKVQKIERGTCEVYLPFSRRTKNPFRSVYFAAQCMAAELSTGLLVMAETLACGKKTSMLVTGMHAHFFKKAEKAIVFRCNADDIIINAIQQAIQTGDGVKFTLFSEGTLSDGTQVASFEFEWSIKIKP